MNITDLYRNHLRFPWVSLSVSLCCVLITALSITIPSAYPYLAYCKYPHFFWQVVSGAFLHGTGDSVSMAFLHLTANLLMFLPHAIMIEKNIGYRRFCILFVASLLSISAAYYLYVWILVPVGEQAYSAGLSGISYCVTTIGAYILFRLFLTDRHRFFQQLLAYVFLFGFIGELLILPLAGIGSAIIHLIGIIVGILLICIFRKSIHSIFNSPLH